jgi:hypothetical protein
MIIGIIRFHWASFAKNYLHLYIGNEDLLTSALLPKIVMKNSGDAFRDKDILGDEVCKLIAIVRLRDEMVRFLPGCKLLPPTRMDGKAIAGLQAKPLTWLGEGADFLAAYHDLRRQVVG